LIVAIPVDSASGRQVVKLKLNIKFYIKIKINYVSGNVERKISNIQAHVRSQTCGVKRCPQAITKFSKQFVPDFAKISLSINIQFYFCLKYFLSYLITLINTPF
jgi:hypothetical protein